MRPSKLAGEQAYLTVETRQGTGEGFLVTSRMAPDLSVLKLEAPLRASKHSRWLGHRWRVG